MLTNGKDLRTGLPVWKAYRYPVIKPDRLEQDQAADVVVIGAGISGAMIAEQLSRAGLSVIILDRRGAILGSTCASTALLIYEIDTPLIHLMEKIGYDKAVRAWRRSRAGLDSLSAKIDLLNIECDRTYQNSLYLAGNVLDTDGLRQEMHWRNMIGLPTDYIPQGQLKRDYGISRRGALHTFNNLSVNPVHLTAGFLSAAFDQGAHLYAPVTAQSITRHGKKYIVHTDQDAAIHATYVVYATGYEIPKQIHTRRHKISSTWVIATKPQPKKLWPHHDFIWEASDPYLYLRTTSDGRVICGGEDEEFSDEDHRDSLLSRKTTILERKLKKLFPDIDSKAEFAWTGSFGTSTTGLPSIGEMPDFENCYAAMAYGGNGIVFSRIAADMITASICGYPDPDADLFAF